MKEKEILKTIKKWYPQAISSFEFATKITDFVKHNLDIEPQKVLIADSICSDDLNIIQYPFQTQKFLSSFKMGGLCGFPFTGLTGMKAFFSHTPDEGALLIYYGPHIGISKDGTIGETLRFGQNKNTPCCGAAIEAIKNITRNNITPEKITELDYQLNTIEQILFNEKDRVLTAKNSIIEAAEIIYEKIDRKINELLELIDLTNYNCKYVILIGAILINSDRDIGSFTEIRRFDVINTATKQRCSNIDIFKNL